MFNIYATATPPVNKTDSGAPPTPNPPKLHHGDYCFKAQADVTEGDTNKYQINGYSKDFSITDHVDNFCERFVQNRDNLVCKETRLSFLGKREPCNGEIEVESLLI